MAKQKQSLQNLTDLDWSIRCSKTKMRPDYVPKTTFTDKTANGLTKCIVSWLNLNGWQAERISTTGRYIDNSKVVTDVLGNRKKIGTGKYIKGSGTNGSADISATIKGLSVKIEVKIKDKQSDAQKEYQANIERAGGIYFIARDFDEFIMFYNGLVNPF
jgi:pSer/pThr/pTyr-binding forkhead associated (FHA) protein